MEYLSFSLLLMGEIERKLEDFLLPWTELIVSDFLISKLKQDVISLLNMNIIAIKNVK
jgi:hypothetical protein